MITRFFFAALLGFVFMLPAASTQELPIATEPTATKPLEQGQKVSEVILKGMDRKDISLASLYEKKPLVIVFFRGGWCPICTKHTQQLIKIYPELKKKGFEMIGVSPDSIENTKANIDKNSIPFPLYSDFDLIAATGFGLAFKVDDATVTKYKGFGIDLEKASGGQTHHGLPIPAIYLIDKEGVVKFAHSNPDYQQRLDPTELLAAIEKLSAPSIDGKQATASDSQIKSVNSNNKEKLTIVWTSGDPEVAHRMVLMYGKAAKTNQWFDEVQLIIWGPSARLVAADKEIQAKLTEMRQNGIIIEACVVCADSYGVTDRLRELGIEVKPMGKPLSNIIRQKDRPIITF